MLVRRAFLVAAALVASTLVLPATAASAAPAAVRPHLVSVSGCFIDGGYVVQVCLYQEATVYENVGPDTYWIDVTAYKIVVTNIDPHDAVLTGGQLNMAVYGRCISGCGSGSPDDVINHKFSSGASGTSFTYTVPWHGELTQVDNSGNDWQAADASVNYNYRGRGYTFQSPSICAGYILGTSYSDCN